MLLAAMYHILSYYIICSLRLAGVTLADPRARLLASAVIRVYTRNLLGWLRLGWLRIP